ncbi:MAG: phenylalanine--tRNA ligase subunit alpha [Candidatus Methylarchaceae archaeon HK01B]|nr:phenylalanine--tRNA ligase subunit alpha [Candidatus Methylarchaceae archaeon HK01B]
MKPLHSLERKLLSSLARDDGGLLEDVALKADMTIDQARRAVEWLRSKGMVEVGTTTRYKIEIGDEGRRAADHGLPERRLVEVLKKLGGEAELHELSKASNLTPKEFSAAFGHARVKNWIGTVSIDDKAFVKILTPDQISPEESLLKKFVSKKDLFLDELSEEEKKAVSILIKRPDYFMMRPLKTIDITLTELGMKTAETVKEVKEIDNLTPELIISGRWREHKLRPFDVEAVAPTIYPGKKHPLQRFIDEVREAFISLGFEEIAGPVIQPAFWNFDALFVPQDHPARDMQDTFYISKIKDVKIGSQDMIERVSRVHIDGGITGSRGWGYDWRLDEAKRLVLRTHTTAVTVKYLADNKVSEAKVFSVDKVFRNEKLDTKHLAELHQIEGIVVGRKVTLRDLMGVLNEFYEILGLKKVKFWPTYFPYTEPSLQSIVYVEGFGWMELCGMGIFRPEVTLPLGVKNPVLAWGGGLERLLMTKLHIEDIRELYENNIDWLRKVPLCL